MRNWIESHLARLHELAPDGGMFTFHIRFSRPMVRIVTNASDWTTHYTENNYLAGDPSLMWSLRNSGAIRWSELRRSFPDPLGVLADAAARGLRYGLTVGCGSGLSRSAGAVSREDREFSDQEISEIEILLRRCHSTLAEKAVLTERQVEALEGVSVGMTYDEICKTLGISRTALKYRLVKARDTLGADTNAEAVRIAIDAGYFATPQSTGIGKSLPRGRVAA